MSGWQPIETTNKSLRHLMLLAYPVDISIEVPMKSNPQKKRSVAVGRRFEVAIGYWDEERSCWIRLDRYGCLNKHRMSKPEQPVYWRKYDDSPPPDEMFNPI